MADSSDLLLTPIKSQKAQYSGSKQGTKVKSKDSSTDSLFTTKENKSILTDEFIKIDGKIDETMQGLVNDCGTLSGLNALSYSEAGRKAIKDAISQDENGVITVKFKAVNMEYTITPEEMDETSASLGDGDMKAFEIALKKYRKDIRDGKVEINKDIPEIIYQEGIFDNPLEGGSGEQIMSLLTGNKSNSFFNRLLKRSFTDEGKKRKEAFDNFLEDFEKKPEKYAATVNFEKMDEDKGITLNHEYAVKKIDGDNVVLVNPWDSSKETVISKDEFLSSFMSITTIEVEKKESVYNKISNFFRGFFN